MEKLKDHKHHIIYILLAIIIVLLLSRDKAGRYAISSTEGGTYVLDTKTSKLLVRVGRRGFYMGTIKNPKFEEIPIESETSKDNK